MPALVAGIHVLHSGQNKDVDGRNKSGHDERVVPFENTALRGSHLLQQHAVPDVIGVHSKCVLASFMCGVEKPGQAGEAVEIDLDEIGDGVSPSGKLNG